MVMVDSICDGGAAGGFCGWCRFFGLCNSEVGVGYGDEACWEFMPDWPEAEV